MIGRVLCWLGFHDWRTAAYLHRPGVFDACYRVGCQARRPR